MRHLAGSVMIVCTRRATSERETAVLRQNFEWLYLSLIVCMQTRILARGVCWWYLPRDQWSQWDSCDRRCPKQVLDTLFLEACVGPAGEYIKFDDASCFDNHTGRSNLLFISIVCLHCMLSSTHIWSSGKRRNSHSSFSTWAIAQPVPSCMVSY